MGIIRLLRYWITVTSKVKEVLLEKLNFLHNYQATLHAYTPHLEVWGGRQRNKISSSRFYRLAINDVMF